MRIWGGRKVESNGEMKQDPQEIKIPKPHPHPSPPGPSPFCLTTLSLCLPPFAEKKDAKDKWGLIQVLPLM